MSISKILAHRGATNALLETLSWAVPEGTTLSSLADDDDSVQRILSDLARLLPIIVKNMEECNATFAKIPFEVKMLNWHARQDRLGRLSDGGNPLEPPDDSHNQLQYRAPGCDSVAPVPIGSDSIENFPEFTHQFDFGDSVC